MGSPRTLARLSRVLHGDLGGSGDIPGPLDLLHIAVKDVTGSERVACSSATPATLMCVFVCVWYFTLPVDSYNVQKARSV